MSSLAKALAPRGSIRSETGFTLIELLIVIAIIGLLATVAVAAVSGARAKARDEKRVTDLKQIQKALELSYEPGSGYPSVAAPITLGTATTAVLCAKNGASAFVAADTPAACETGKVFMGLVPSNPSPNGAPYEYRSLNDAGAVCAAGLCTGYCVEATLERGLPQSGLAAGTVIVDASSLRNGTCP